MEARKESKTSGNAAVGVDQAADENTARPGRVRGNGPLATKLNRKVGGELAKPVSRPLLFWVGLVVAGAFWLLSVKFLGWAEGSQLTGAFIVVVILSLRHGRKQQEKSIRFFK